MSNSAVFVIIGFSGIVAQVFLLRELLVTFLGNELTVGIMLAHWILAEAAGVYILGWAVQRSKRPGNVFLVMQILFALSFLAGVYLSRTLKFYSGVGIGEAASILVVLIGSCACIAPVAFIHGGLFTVLCTLTGSVGPLAGRAYAWELVGTVIGGLVCTFIFISHIPSFTVVFLVTLLNILLCLFYPVRRRRFVYVLFFSLLFYFFASHLQSLEKTSIQKQFPGRSIVAYQDSVYGNVAVSAETGQYTFYTNGVPAVTSPNPDTYFSEDFGHIPLLFSPDPRHMLIIGNGAGGVVHEALKHPLDRLDYVELDPLVIKMIRRYQTPLTESEFSDIRVRTANSDARYFLTTCPDASYDVMLIGASVPSDLSANRFFTEEFFSLARSRLRPQGVLALWLPGSLEYMSPELSSIHLSIMRALSLAFTSVRIVPGEYTLYLASSENDILTVDAVLLSRRLEDRKIKTAGLSSEYLRYRLNDQSRAWFLQQLSRIPNTPVNSDIQPFAVFAALVFWSKEFASRTLPIFLMLLGVRHLIPAFLLIIAGGLGVVLLGCRQRAKLIAPFVIVTTGFAGMLLNLVLVAGFQVVRGYLYQQIGLLIACLMAGSALGAALASRLCTARVKAQDILARFEIFVALCALVIAGAVTFFPLMGGEASSAVFAALFIILGLLVGAEFPIAIAVYTEAGGQPKKATGLLYAADLLGGWFAGMTGGIFLLPLVGLFKACMIAAGVKLVSALIISLAHPEKPLTK